MKYYILVITIFMLLFACGTNVSNIEQIEQQLLSNGCDRNRQALVYKLHDLEYENDTLYTVLPLDLLPDSICTCPLNGSFYLLLDANKRVVECPNGHGITEL